MFTTLMQKEMELSYSMKTLHKEWRELFEASEGFMEQYNLCLDYLTRWAENLRISDLLENWLPD